MKLFNEGQLRFAPTYKYQTGTNIYNRQYVPAYTDRVLWSSRRIEEASHMRLCHYNRAELNLSDHKPVLAVFEA